MMNKDILTLWEQEGDLERMKWFFAKLDPDLEQKERIKQLALEKIREEEKRCVEQGTTDLEESPILNDLSTGFKDLSNESPHILESKTFGARIQRRIKFLWTRRSWKIGVPAVAALLLIVMIGQAGINGSFDFSLGNMKKSLESQTAAQNAREFYDTIDPASPDATMTKGKNTQGYASGNPPTVGTPHANDAIRSGAAQNKESVLTDPAPGKGSDSQSSATPPPSLPQPQPDVPPADETLPRKITYNMNVTLQVDDVNLALERITQEVNRLGGYVAQSSQDEYQNNSFAHAVLKVPSGQLEGIRGLLPALGKVLNQQTVANDITSQYYDTETRLRSWQAQEARYLEILKEAQSVEEILKIEGALGNIRMQIEQLKGQLKLWDHEVSYSTIQLNLQTTPNPVNITDPWQPVSWSKTWQAAKDAVLKTLSSTWNGLNYLVVGLAYAFPYLIVLGVLFGIYKGIKRFRR